MSSTEILTFGFDNQAETPAAVNIDITSRDQMDDINELRQWLAADPHRLVPRHQIHSEDGGIKWVETDGKEVIREVDRERAAIARYLSSEAAAYPGHYALVEQVALGMAPMTQECRVAVNVPAWLEERALPVFLEQFVNQSDNSGNVLDPKIYEINILINRETGTEPDNSISIIEGIIRDHKWRKPKINYHDIELPPPFSNVGYARKLLSDAVVLRSLRRPQQAGCLYIQSEDSDTARIDARQISKVVKKMDNHPYLDAIRGQQDRMPEYLIQNDFLFLSCRLRDFLETLVSRKEYRDPRDPDWNFNWNRIITGGWNTVFSAEAYALIEGYEPLAAGEDMSIGQRISMVRGDGMFPNLEVVGRIPTRSDGSPRRFINQLRNGRDAYEDFSNKEDNLTIRSQTLEEAMATVSEYSRINPANQASLNKFAQMLFEDFKDIKLSGSSRDEVINSLMFWLGFQGQDYSLSETGIQIHSWDNVIRALESYRQKHQSGAGS